MSLTIDTWLSDSSEYVSARRCSSLTVDGTTEILQMRERVRFHINKILNYRARNFSFGGLFLEGQMRWIRRRSEIPLAPGVASCGKFCGGGVICSDGNAGGEVFRRESCSYVGICAAFSASRSLWVAGAPGSGTEGTKDVDSGERESESFESPQDVKKHEDDGKTDRDEEELQEKPVVQVGIEKVRDNLAGSSS